MSVKKYLTLNGLTYFLNKIKTYLTSSTYLNSIGIANSDIDDIADDAGYSSGSLPASEDIFITGDIIPNTDNSVDLGASSKNIKMIYTKGITINGTQFLPSNYAQVSHTHTKSDITDFPTLATVATSGSYNDLTNKPTIPDVSNYYTKAEVDTLINNAGISPSANTVFIGEPYSLVSTEINLGNYEEVSND